MQCISCQAPIHPEFVHSIKCNTCPACGGSMMNDAAQELLKELGEALVKMPNDPQGIAGWLLSNYELRKIGTGEPVNEFYGTPKQSKPGQPPGTLKVPESRIQQFFKQAGVKQPKKPEDYAEIVQEIQTAGGADYGTDGVVIEVNEDFVEEARDPEYTQQVLSAMQGKPPRRASIGGAAAASQDLDANMSDLHPALRGDRMHRLKQQLEVGQGGVGKIRRS